MKHHQTTNRKRAMQTLVLGAGAASLVLALAGMLGGCSSTMPRQMHVVDRDVVDVDAETGAVRIDSGTCPQIRDTDRFGNPRVRWAVTTDGRCVAPDILFAGDLFDRTVQRSDR